MRLPMQRTLTVLLNVSITPSAAKCQTVYISAKDRDLHPRNSDEQVPRAYLFATVQMMKEIMSMTEMKDKESNFNIGSGRAHVEVQIFNVSIKLDDGSVRC